MGTHRWPDDDAPLPGRRSTPNQSDRRRRCRRRCVDSARRVARDQQVLVCPTVRRGEDRRRLRLPIHPRGAAERDIHRSVAPRRYGTPAPLSGYFLRSTRICHRMSNELVDDRGGRWDSSLGHASIHRRSPGRHPERATVDTRTPRNVLENFDRKLFNAKAVRSRVTGIRCSEPCFGTPERCRAGAGSCDVCESCSFQTTFDLWTSRCDVLGC